MTKKPPPPPSEKEEEEGARASTEDAREETSSEPRANDAAPTPSAEPNPPRSPDDDDAAPSFGRLPRGTHRSWAKTPTAISSVRRSREDIDAVVRERDAVVDELARRLPHESVRASLALRLRGSGSGRNAGDGGDGPGPGSAARRRKSRSLRASVDRARASLKTDDLDALERDVLDAERAELARRRGGLRGSSGLDAASGLDADAVADALLAFATPAAAVAASA